MGDGGHNLDEMNNDASDLTAAAGGNREAFARLYDRHAPLVLSLCRRCGSLSEAEDATQETFLRAYRKLDQLTEPAGFRPWLCAIARRVCAERYRTRARREKRENESAMQGLTASSDDPDGIARVELAEQLARLTEAINHLDEQERLAIHLHYLEPDPSVSAREILGLSHSGYYKLLNRARTHLAGMMRKAAGI